MFDVMLARGC